MTKAELIAILAELPDDAEIFVEAVDSDGEPIASFMHIARVAAFNADTANDGEFGLIQFEREARQ